MTTFNESITEILEAKITSSQAVAAIRAAIDERIGADIPHDLMCNTRIPRLKGVGCDCVANQINNRNADLRQAFGITKEETKK